MISQSTSEKNPVFANKSNEDNSSDTQLILQLKMKLRILYILCMFILSLTLINYSLDMMREHHTDQKMDQIMSRTKYTYKHRNLRWMMMHHHHKKRKDACESEFGCCEIYHECSSETNHNETILSSAKYHLMRNRYTFPKRDIYGTNCPSLEHIAELYNYYYKDTEDCSQSKYGCCDIDVSCDNSMRYNHSVSTKENMYSFTIQKQDELGSNCPTDYALMDAYNYNFPGIGETLLNIILICLFICYLCKCMHSENRKTQTYRYSQVGKV